MLSLSLKEELPWCEFLLLSENLAEESWLFWVICMPLATILLGNSLESYFDMLTTTCPGWLSTFTACSSSTHYFSSLLLDFDLLVIY
jgi:hypothetical protein